jgi:FixJ family two-component response regulator
MAFIVPIVDFSLSPFDQALTQMALYASPAAISNRTPEAALPDSALISVIDDDESVREATRGLLRSFGFVVQTFPSAQDFLQSLRLQETSCLIADIHMPVMTGVELHARLVELGHTIPTILITAYPDECLRARALNDGVTCHLAKPFGADDLLRCVRQALEQGKTTDGQS